MHGTQGNDDRLYTSPEWPIDVMHHCECRAHKGNGIDELSFSSDMYPALCNPRCWHKLLREDRALINNRQLDNATNNQRQG